MAVPEGIFFMIENNDLARLEMHLKLSQVLLF